jgi:hypothetical protein
MDDYNFDGSLNLSLTWDFVFASDENGHLVAAVNLPKPMAERLAVFLSTRREYVLEGIARSIEVDVMNEYIDSSESIRYDFKVAVDGQRPRAAGVGSVSGKCSTVAENDVTPESVVASFNPHQAKDKNGSNTPITMADTLAKMPSWVRACPPDWARYQKTVEYKKNVQHLRQTKYAAVLAFYSKPFDQESFRAYLAYHQSQLTLNASPLTIVDFTLSSIIACDLLYALNPIVSLQSCCGEATGVELWPGKISAFELNILCPESKGVLACTDRKLEAEADASHFYSSLCNEMQNEVRSSYQRSLHSAYSDTASMLFIGPLRDIPKRIYADTTQTKWDGDAVAGEIVPAMLAQDEVLLAQVNRWLMRLGVDYEVEVLRAGIPGYFSLRLRDARSSEPHAACFADVGFGISQILPILVAGLSGKDAIIMIEQPELHIHPRLQAELGTFFAECIKERGHQFIVETHSEHIMLRMQRLIRNRMLEVKSVAVRYVRRNTTGSTIEPLVVNGSGEFVEGWPEGFMPDRLKELL